MINITDLINMPMLYIILYALAATFIIAVLISKLRIKNKKYIHWKREKINIFSLREIEYERNDDWLLNDLFSENQRLETEAKILRKDNTNLSIILVLILVFTLLASKLSKPFKHKQK